MALTRIGCCQIAPVIGDLTGNTELIATQISAAAAAGAQVIVLPELATSGYMFTDTDEARAVALAAGAPDFGTWSAAAGAAVVIGGFCELGDDGRLYNSAAVVDADGFAACYRKTHLWDREKLIFTPGAARDLDIPLAISADAKDGDIFETSPAVIGWTRKLADRLVDHGGAALLIDYGHMETAIGDTLQAVKAHRYHPVLDDPGEADLTAHVDFEAVATAAREMGAKVFGPVPQGAWLARLGITVRAAQLASGKGEAQAQDIQNAVRRLMAPDGMGLLFKVLAFTQPALAACEGFEQDAAP